MRLRDVGLSDKGLLIVVALISGIALASCWFGVRFATVEILRFEAVDAATGWATFLRHDLPSLPQIFAGEPPTEDDAQTIEAAQVAAGIFRYKFFGPDGRITHASRPEDVGKMSTKPYFLDVVANGGTYAKIEEDEEFGAARAVVSEAYVSVMQDGRFLGAIEVYVDRTERAAALARKGLLAFVALASFLLLIGLASSLAVATNIRRHRAAAERLRQSEKLLRDAQRMESLGKLAGGLAHELNNALQPIVTMSQLLLKQPMVTDRNRNRVEHILAAAQRGSGIVQATLTFARGQAQEKEEIRLSEALDEVVSFSQELFPPSVEIEMRVEGDGDAILNRIELTQVMTNLLSNAADAIGHVGKIVIALDRCELDAVTARDRGVQPGDYLRIAVADGGRA